MTPLRRVFLFLLLVGSSTPVWAQNLIHNPGFEEGLTPWLTWGGASLSQTSDVKHSGSFSARVSKRTEIWQGTVQSLMGRLVPGTSYRVSAWVRAGGDKQQTIDLIVVQTDDDGEIYTNITKSLAFPDRWVQITDVLRYSENGPVTRLDFFIQGPEPGVDFYVDDVEILAFPADWQTEADQRIDQLRKRDVKVTVTDNTGKPVNGATVTLKQQSRDFPIGMALGFDAFDTEPNYREYVIGRFNWIVHENEAKWYSNEWARDEVTYHKGDAILNFAVANGIEMRGHNIFWAPEEWQPSWVPGLSDEELAIETNDRLESVVAHFKGSFRHWDVNNEMLHGSFFQDRLGADIRKWMFERTREIDPDVKLFVNDYNIISSGEADSYVRQIQGFLDQGFPIDGIGVQGHFTHVDPWVVLTRLDKVAQFDLPVWVTEFDVVQVDPNDRADELETFFRTAYSHPSVEGILMWGFWAGSHWKGPNAALVDLDWTINAAGQRFDDLMAEWTSNEARMTNGSGISRARVFHGGYEIEINLPNYPTTQLTAQVDPGSSELKVNVKLDFDVIQDFTINAGHTGAWYNPATSGQGLLIDIERENQYMFASWFTFTDAASAHPFEQRWLTAQGNYTGNTTELDVYETLGGQFDDPHAVTTTLIGNVNLSFSDCKQGQLTYNFDDEGLQGSFPLQRAIPGSGNICEGLSGSTTQAVDINAGMDGSWYDPITAGQGFFIDAHPDPMGGNFIFVAWFTYGDDTASGQRWLTAQGSFEDSLAEIDVFETTGGSFDDPRVVNTENVGTMTIDFTDCSNALLTYSLTDSGAEGDIAITRVVPGAEALCEELNGAE